MNKGLYDLVVARLLAADLDDEAMELVDAACRGDAPLASVPGGEAASLRVRAEAETRASMTIPKAYLRSVRVRGFRGVGAESILDLQPSPGLTLIVGRNGSGKSSFAEALETVLTGTCRRWAGRRQKAWADGWHNLHERTASLEATFVVEGSPHPVVVRRSWRDAAALDEGELGVRQGPDRSTDLDALGWTDPLRSFRPFLSYAELGTLLDEPSQLYDSLEAILGLEGLAAARDRLQSARKDLDDQAKDAKEGADTIRAALDGMTDPRAEACASAMQGRAWNLAAVESSLARDSDDPGDALAELRALAALEGPDLERIDAAIRGVREALEIVQRLEGTAADQSGQLAELLDHAVRFHEQFQGDCPVCGGALAGDWRALAIARVDAARRIAADARRASADLRTHATTLRTALRPVPSALERSSTLAATADALACWRSWIAAPEGPDDLARHVEEHALPLDQALTRLREQAREELAAREDSWRPIAARLRSWLEGAQRVEADAARRKALKRAEKWMKDTEEALRDERFEPIAGRAQQIWALLRQQSDVDLQRVELEGTKTRRHVKLNVTVDGRDSVALAVMSQGELNALALSLFLPRMTFAESPFGFVVVDDPVQAMDPQKVDGLARVLGEVAKTRQVVVLTHDPRLLEAIQRLGIPASAIEVHRSSGSAIELVQRLDAVARHLDDARALTKRDQLPREVTARVVPGLCRAAVEAASIETIRRRRLGRGDTHASVDDAITSARDTLSLAALAMFDDDARRSEVLPKLDHIEPRLADVLRICKEGAHHGSRADPDELIRDASRLALRLREWR